MWQGFLQEASQDWPLTRFERPADGLTRVRIDPFTGMRAADGAESVNEWFIPGTEPRDQLAADACGEDVLTAFSAPRAYENQFSAWMAADRDWLRRAGRGTGRRRRPGPDAHVVLLQRRVPAVRVVLGGARDRRMRRAEPVTVVHPAPDAGREWRHPVARDPLAKRLGGGGLAVRAAVPIPIGVRVRDTATHRHATPDADADAHTDPDTHTDADAHPDPDTHAHAHTDTDTHALTMIVDLAGVTVRRGGRTILGPVDWQVRSGERWVVLGPNGSGKTTLLSVAGLDALADERVGGRPRGAVWTRGCPRRTPPHRVRGECRRGRLP